MLLDDFVGWVLLGTRTGVERTRVEKRTIDKTQLQVQDEKLFNPVVVWGFSERTNKKVPRN